MSNETSAKAAGGVLALLLAVVGVGGKAATAARVGGTAVKAGTAVKLGGAAVALDYGDDAARAAVRFGSSGAAGEARALGRASAEATELGRAGRAARGEVWAAEKSGAHSRLGGSTATASEEGRGVLGRAVDGAQTAADAHRSTEDDDR